MISPLKFCVKLPKSACNICLNLTVKIVSFKWVWFEQESFNEYYLKF